MEKLDRLNCSPLNSSSLAMTQREIETYLPQVPEWQLIRKDDMPCLERVFKFKDFKEALNFTNQVGQAANQQDHHPAILTEYGSVTIDWWTHKVKGLHLNDFIMAARIDDIIKSLR